MGRRGAPIGVGETEGAGLGGALKGEEGVMMGEEGESRSEQKEPLREESDEPNTIMSNFGSVKNDLRI